MKPIIEVSNLSKVYKLSHQSKRSHLSIREDLVKVLKGLSLRRSGKEEEFWALKDISFNVDRGEVIGIIGRNGSGKSTLLKILSRVVEPTNGQVVMRGKVASLLEVGTGFHPELTGRENIFLNGAILGMSKKEISRKFDQIVEFAGIEKFLDTPVKRYSSGMYVRLAFSVAAHLEPDILIVDEVLAVGDAEFQRKCLNKMEEVTKGEGRTIILVSHNMDAIKKLCTRCILINNGRIEMIGPTNKVVEKYLDRDALYPMISLKDRKDRGGKGGVRFTDIRVTNTKDENEIQSGDRLRIRLKYESDFKESINDVRIVSVIVDEDLQTILWLDSDVTKNSFTDPLPSRGFIVCETHEANLIEGRYFITINFHIKGESVDLVVMACDFRIKTRLQSYEYRIEPDKTTSKYLIKYSYSQSD